MQWEKFEEGYSVPVKSWCVAPQAYKDIESVIDSERDLIDPLIRLMPLASLKG